MSDILRNMLNNLINDKPEEATLDLHNYLTTKMKDVAGIGGTEEPVVADETVVGDEIPADLETAPEDVE